MMTNKDAIKIFEDRKIRSLWDDEQENWNDLKIKLKTEGSELSDFFGQLKMQSSDGKFYKTNVADTEQLFRLIQSITRQ